MKKFLILLVASLVALSSFGQSDLDHLSFKGIPIDGPYNSFIAKLKQKGFKQDLSDSRVLSGNFAGYSDCKIVVRQNKERDVVFAVGVITPPEDTWKNLSASYYHLKDMLITKYGKPYEEIEEFQRPYMADSDNSKMHEVKMGHYVYKTVFVEENGDIVLSISQVEHEICYIQLLYIDKINNIIRHSDAIDDL